VPLVRLALSRAALRRTVPAMLVVGSVLTLVNSGSRLADGDVDGWLLVKVFFTFAVPFGNATYGFVSGVRADDA
jgi:hypothetical protein